uniref:Integrase catalytic domain-containing protein n=1 Tax=Vitis vinifera TaxID=29760 RepID=A5C6M3_VITVI|nr:hypothetical protein VITISV_044133 [Vitis vinifera]
MCHFLLTIQVENSVLLTVLQQLRVDGAEVELENKTLDQELNITAQQLLVLQNKKHELLEMNRQLGLEVSKRDHLEGVKCDVESLCKKLKEKCMLEEENSAILHEAVALSNLSLVLNNFWSEKVGELKALAEDFGNFHGVNSDLGEEKLDKELHEVTNLSDQLNNQLSVGKDLLSQKEKDLSEAKQKLKAAQDLTAELFGTVEELKRECEKSEVLRENSEKQILELSEENTSQNREIECLRKMNGNLESELDMLHEEIEEYRIRGEKLNSELHERSNDFELWEAEATTFYFDLQASSVSEVLFENKMRERVSFLESEIGGLKVQLSAYGPIIVSLRDNIASLEHNALFQTKLQVADNQKPKDDLTEKHLPIRSFGTVLARGENQRQTAGGSDLARKKLKPDRNNAISIYKDTDTGVSMCPQLRPASKMKVVALVSGGKDSCYAMMKCIQYGHEIVALANLLPADDSVDELDSYMYQTKGGVFSAENQEIKQRSGVGDEVERLLDLGSQLLRMLLQDGSLVEFAGSVAKDLSGRELVVRGEVDMTTKNPIFTSVISGSPTITSEKLIGSENYLYWLASMELWFMGQGYEDHLVTPKDVIPDVDKCIMAQTDKFFMVLTLIGLRPNLESVQNQILASPSVPSLDDVFARLLHLSSTQTLLTDGPSDSSVLAFQANSRGGRSGNRGRGQRPQCTYCNKLGHTRNRCYQLHARPPHSAHIAQSSDPLLSRPDFAASSTSQSITLIATSASVAQTDNVFVCFTQSPSLGPWILDFGVFDHISGNKHLFSSITTTSVLSTVTLANGSQTMAKGIGLAHPLPSLPLHSVLYALECPFNLISISKITCTLNCSITFSDKSVILQDRSTGKTIGIGPCISTDALLLIHNRLGHPNLSKFQKIVPCFSTLSSLACESCQLGKYTRVSFPKRLNNRAKSHFELVHIDVWGLCRTASILGFQYFVTFINDYSRCTWLFLMKNQAELFSIFQKFYAEIQTQFKVSIRVLRSDNVREYFSTPFTSFMSQHGILHQSSCAHTPQQNGVAECKNRHLVETARTLLLHSHVLFRFWGDAVLTACYLINRMSSSILHDQIPHSLIFPTQPLYFLSPCVFGCTCFVHTLTPGQDKLSAKATKCIFLGCSRLQKGYRCYSPDIHRYFLSADVTFFEDSPFFSSSESLPIFEVYHRRHRAIAPSLSSAEVPNNSPPGPPISPTSALSSTDHLLIALRKGNRSTHNPYPIYNFLSYHRLSSSYSAFVSTLSSVFLPKSISEILSHPGWRQTMVDEMVALHFNGTWDLVSLPLGKSTVGCRWVYTVKVGPDGQVNRLKARLVAKGYTQIYGCDYGDTFSPVAKIAFLDIKNAFLYAELLEEVYMEQPPGFVAQGESGLVCKLRRSLYGLKQSPRAWFGHFSSVVQEFGMLWSEADHSVFYHHNSSSQCIYLVVYVDDIVITSSDQEGIQRLKQHLFNHFQTKDLGKLKKYVLDILEETGMLECKPIDTPMNPNVKLVPGQGESLRDPGRYRRLVGKLNYLTITRPDISFPVSVVSQFLQSPCDNHWDAVIRIL